MHGLERYKEAIEAYDKGLNLDPNNAQMKEDSVICQRKARQQSSPLHNPEIMKAKLAANPETRELANDPQFLTMF